MGEFLQSIPSWVGALGWLAVLIGFRLQRKALINASNKTTIIGGGNTVSNTTNQSTHSANADGGGDSLLSLFGNWASLIGLALSLLPLLKDWLGKAG